jgi:hypothetical protein
MPPALGVLWPPPSGTKRVHDRYIERGTELCRDHHRRIDAVETPADPRPRDGHQRSRSIVLRLDQRCQPLDQRERRNRQPLILDAVDQTPRRTFVEKAGSDQQAIDDVIWRRCERSATAHTQRKRSCDSGT